MASKSDVSRSAVVTLVPGVNIEDVPSRSSGVNRLLAVFSSERIAYAPRTQ